MVGARRRPALQLGENWGQREGTARSTPSPRSSLRDSCRRQDYSAVYRPSAAVPNGPTAMPWKAKRKVVTIDAVDGGVTDRNVAVVATNRQLVRRTIPGGSAGIDGGMMGGDRSPRGRVLRDLRGARAGQTDVRQRDEGLDVVVVLTRCSTRQRRAESWPESGRPRNAANTRITVRERQPDEEDLGIRGG